MRAKGGDYIEERLQFVRPSSLGRFTAGGASHDPFTGFRTFRPSRHERATPGVPYAQGLPYPGPGVPVILPHNLMVIRGGGWQTSTKNNVRGAAPAGKFPAPPNAPGPAKGFRTFRPVRQPSP